MTERKAKYNPEADKKWAESNRQHKTYLSNRSTAKSFIRNKATQEDLDMLKKLIEQAEGESKMRNTTNPLIEEKREYNPKWENKHAKYARVVYSGNTEFTVLTNENFGTRKHKPNWTREDGELVGVVDANPTAIMASHSNFEISIDGENWEKISEMVK